jgi:hypothetical protein
MNGRAEAASLTNFEGYFKLLWLEKFLWLDLFELLSRDYFRIQVVVSIGLDCGLYSEAILT